MAGKTKSQKKKALDMRSKMYLVLALCSVMLLVSVGISLVLIGGIALGGTRFLNGRIGLNDLA